MRVLPSLVLLCAGFASASAAESIAPSPAAKTASVQNGKMMTVHLLATGRVTSKDVPDGLRFLFLVKRSEGVTGTITLKETRDFRLADASYQERTHAELGKKFEPSTVLHDADKFFTQQPRLRGLAPEDINDATILTLAIGGAPLPSDGRAEVTLNVGVEKEVEPFTFEVKIPPAPSRPAVKS